MKFPQTTKNRTIIWSSNSTPEYISEENGNTNSKRSMHPSVHSSIIYNSQDMKTTQVPIKRWMDKEDVRYTHTHTHTHTGNGILLSLKNEWSSFICNNVVGPGKYYA